MPYLRRVFIIVLVTLLYVPGIVHAQIIPSPAVDPGCIPSDFGCVPTDVGGFVKQYYTYGLGIIGGLSLLFIVFGGYIILTSRGNPQQLNNGKSYIGYAIIGLVLAIFGYLFVEVIAKDVLHIPGFA